MVVAICRCSAGVQTASSVPHSSRAGQVIAGNSGLFIAMPAKRRKDGTYKDIAHPLNADTRDLMEKTILMEYERQRLKPVTSRELATMDD